jgi:ubiquinone/menaquinone biosynthesis methyltransferase
MISSRLRLVNLPAVVSSPSLQTTTTSTTRIRRSFASQTAAAATAVDSGKTDPYLTGSSTHFGFQEVAVGEKEGRVREVFDNVADSYDVMNDLMSAGLHRMWKDHLLQVSSVAALSRAVRRNPTESELRILDVAGGTGDVAFRFLDAAESLERSKSSGKDPISVTVCDINHEMLRVGERRARERYGSQLLDETKALSFVQGNAEKLVNWEDNTFDLYTIAFGLRNVTNVDQALSEACRVLKPGGRFMCLEFSQVPNTVLRNIYDTYSFNVIPAMGEMVANDRASYQYLVESIRKFSNQDELLQRMKTAGFQGVKYTNLTGGIVALHEGWKPL